VGTLKKIAIAVRQANHNKCEDGEESYLSICLLMLLPTTFCFPWHYELFFGLKILMFFKYCSIDHLLYPISCSILLIHAVAVESLEGNIFQNVKMK